MISGTPGLGTMLELVAGEPLARNPFHLQKEQKQQMRKRRKQSKQTVLANEEATYGVFTDEELKSRLEVALREALSVIEQSSPELRRPLSSFETSAEQTLDIVNDFDH